MPGHEPRQFPAVSQPEILPQVVRALSSPCHKNRKPLFDLSPVRRIAPEELAQTHLVGIDRNLLRAVAARDHVHGAGELVCDELGHRLGVKPRSFERRVPVARCLFRRDAQNRREHVRVEWVASTCGDGRHQAIVWLVPSRRRVSHGSCRTRVKPQDVCYHESDSLWDRRERRLHIQCRLPRRRAP